MLKTIKHYDYEPIYYLTYIQNNTVPACHIIQTWIHKGIAERRRNKKKKQYRHQHESQRYRGANKIDTPRPPDRNNERAWGAEVGSSASNATGLPALAAGPATVVEGSANEHIPPPKPATDGLVPVLTFLCVCQILFLRIWLTDHLDKLVQIRVLPLVHSFSSEIHQGWCLGPLGV